MVICQQPLRSSEGKQARGIQEITLWTKDAEVTKLTFFTPLVLFSNISILGTAAAPVTAKNSGRFYTACAYSTPKVITKMYTTFGEDNYHQVDLNGA